MKIEDIVDEKKIFQTLDETKNFPQSKAIGIARKALSLKGLAIEEVGILLNSEDPEVLKEIFRVAGIIKRAIYGERLVFFAPLYLSNFCVNDCEYCGFHFRNKILARKKLTLEEVADQTKILIEMGHKRLLLEAGEDPKKNPIDYIVDCIRTIYSVKVNGNNIRRVNVNIAATTIEDYKRLKAAKIGTYQLFQETYHYETYKKLHRGPKADYERQLFAHNRAMEAGIDDLGLGVLFGLYDWKFEVLALLSHAKYLDQKYGVGPHTISFPRFCPAETVTFKPEYRPDDQEFLKIIAILRLAVPYTGMILSTRERPEIRKKAFQLGISQASAASVTTPGGYGKEKRESGQFSLYDHRSLSEIVESILKDNLLPSFCTACYRSGRTGERFMKLAKPGEIHNFCRPNAILTFYEYLQDFAPPLLQEKGRKTIEKWLAEIPNLKIRQETALRLERIEKGERDIYF